MVGESILEKSEEIHQICKSEQELKAIEDEVIVNTNDKVIEEETFVSFLGEKETEEEVKAINEELHKNVESIPVVNSSVVDTKPSDESIVREDFLSSQKEKNYTFYLIAIIVVVLFLCGGLIGYVYLPDLFPSWFQKNEPVVLQSVNQSSHLDIICVDSIDENKVDTLSKTDTLCKATMAQISEIKKEIKNGEEIPVIETKNTLKKTESTKPMSVSVVSSKKVSEVEKKKPVITYSDSVTYEIVGTKIKHTVKSGETLTRISLRYYGTKAMWPYIVKHNKGVIKNPDNVPYGTIIRIPELAKNK